MAQLTARRARQAEYRQYLRSFRWQVVRRLRKAIDLGVCQDCLRVGRINRRRLQVHHESYEHRGGSLEGELMDTVTLCVEHHAKRHGKRAKDD
jgi:5-methylcytosine-specific restriction endonuclease McrA